MAPSGRCLTARSSCPSLASARCTSPRTTFPSNPHLRQAFASRRPFVRRSDDKPLTWLDRVVGEHSGRTKYMRRIGEVKTVEHWGQRKLFFSELEFFLLHAPSNGEQTLQVLYAGAAPGRHINFLSQLFPHLRFHLVDPAPFDLQETEKITVERDYFTDASARRWRDKVDLFISDIRAIAPGMTVAQMEAQVVVDLQCQQGWVRELRPRLASMLKFRLPYTPGTTEYLDGDLHFPVFGGRVSSESCLIVPASHHFKTREYDHGWYEDIMFHFNTVTRTTYFPHTTGESEGLDHCFDCASEVFLLQQYLQKTRPELNGLSSSEEEKLKLAAEVTQLSREISQQCSAAGRTLKSGMFSQNE